MAPRVVILVPWQPGDPDRERAWAYVGAAWAAYAPTYVGSHDGVPFSKAAAVNRAAHDAGAWDVAVIADADTVVPRPQLARCVQITRGAAWPFNRLHRLTPEGTVAVIAGALLAQAARLATATYAPGGVVVVRRALWDRVGGFDERFAGWGGEDNAFISALRTFGGNLPRVPGPAYHLWHPHAATRYAGPFYDANLRLSKRYGAALGKPEAMDGLLRERLAAP